MMDKTYDNSRWCSRQTDSCLCSTARSKIYCSLTKKQFVTVKSAIEVDGGLDRLLPVTGVIGLNTRVHRFLQDEPP